MRIFRFVGRTMFAALLVVNITACSSGDDDNDAGMNSQENKESNNNQENQENQGVVWNFEQKYIKRLQTDYIAPNINYQSCVEIYDVSYNEYNLLSKIDRTIEYPNRTEISDHWEFDYGKLEITHKKDIYSFSIGNNGCITEIKIKSPKGDGAPKYKSTFRYDEERNLISVICDTEYGGNFSNLSGIRTYLFTWNNGNLVEYKTNYEGGQNIVILGDGITKYEYGSLVNKGMIAPYFGAFTLRPFNSIASSIVMSCGLFGNVSRNLMTRVGNSDYIDYTYGLDEQGFVTSMDRSSDIGFKNFVISY